ACAQVVHQAEFKRPLAEPVFAGRDPVDIEAGAEAADVVLEQAMRVLELLLELLPALLGVLAENGQRALVLAGGKQLEIDIMLLQQPVEIGQLGDDADGADDGEGRSQDTVGDTGHQVAAAGGDAVDGDGQLSHPPLQPSQLGCRQPVVGDHAAAALQPYQHLVIRAGDQQDAGDFLPQALDLRSPEVAVEVEDEQARPAGGLPARPGPLLDQPPQRLAVQQPALQSVAEAVQAVVEPGDFQPLPAPAARAAAETGRD